MNVLEVTTIMLVILISKIMISIIGVPVIAVCLSSYFIH
jgi:hypothetical protein